MNMTQVWSGDNVVSCTLVQAGPCLVTQIKDDKSDSYKAVQISYGYKKPKNLSKSVKGHLKKAINREDARYLREFRLKEDNPNLELGKVIDVSTFAKGDIIDVVSTSKGKGFQGVVRRHGFSGTKKTHGNKDQLRASGSVGAKGPAHVFKGTRMGGRMGGDRVTTKNLEIVDVDIENNILFIKGAVPGATNGLVMIKGQGELIVKDLKENIKKDENKTGETPVLESEEKVEAVVEEVSIENAVEEKKEDKMVEAEVAESEVKSEEKKDDLDQKKDKE